jgi:uncharacterized protein HemX
VVAAILIPRQEELVEIMNRYYEELLLDIIESWCLEPEQLVEVAVLPLIAGAAISSAIGMGASKVGGAAGARAGKQQADKDIKQQLNKSRKDREQKMRELIQKRKDMAAQIEQQKMASVRTAGAVSAG